MKECFLDFLAEFMVIQIVVSWSDKKDLNFVLIYKV